MVLKKNTLIIMESIFFIKYSFFNNKMDFFLLIDVCVCMFFLFLVPNDNYTPLIVDINII